MKRKFHVRCEAGENLEITSKSYLSLYIFDTLFPEEEEVNQKLQQLEEFMKLLTEDQRNLIYEYFGARKTLKQICDEENEANGTDKSPQSVGNRKKILERLKKFFEKAEQ